MTQINKKLLISSEFNRGERKIVTINTFYYNLTLLICVMLVRNLFSIFDCSCLVKTD